MQKQIVFPEILKHPDPDTWTEMTRDDLEQILDEELSKPEALMDTGLIRELLLQLRQICIHKIQGGGIPRIGYTADVYLIQNLAVRSHNTERF